MSPERILRAGIQTLLTGTVTVTKDSGPKTVKYVSKTPKARPFFPYMQLTNIFNLPDNAKACRGWRPLVRLQTFTGATPGHNSPDYADEISEQITAFMTDKPLVLDLSPTFAVISCNIEASNYNESFDSLRIGKKTGQYHIIQKITDYRLELQEL